MTGVDKFLYSVHDVGVRKALAESGLKIRKGKSINDVYEVMNKKRQPCITTGLFPNVQTIRYGKLKTYGELHEEKAEELDGILTMYEV
jgi:hypothetical protein